MNQMRKPRKEKKRIKGQKLTLYVITEGPRGFLTGGPVHPKGGIVNPRKLVTVEEGYFISDFIKGKKGDLLKALNEAGAGHTMHTPGQRTVFTTLKEPKLIQYLRDFNEVNIIDQELELEPFLKEQYRYEINRVPVHNAFKATYRSLFFNINDMLSYYMNPWGDDTNFLYYINNHPSEHRPLITKRLKK